MSVFCGYSHILINITTYCVIKWIFRINTQPYYSAIIILWIVLGSILADIDHKKSMIGKYLIFPFYVIFNGNRTFSHTVVGALVFSIPVLIYNPNIGCVFFISYIGHLLMDTLTPMGIMWLYPISNRYFSLNLNIELIIVVLSFIILIECGMWKYLIH